MAYEATGLPSCKASFFRASPNNKLPTQSSSKLSIVVVRSWGALVLGIICALATGYVLFEDVIKNGAPFTSNHVLTCVVLAITAAAGHMWWQELRGLRVTGLGLILVFLVGSGYLVVASGGRNAEVAMTKRNAAHFANEERKRIKPLLERAEKMLEEQRAIVAREAVKVKCGDVCKGAQVSAGVYEAAVKGHKADLEKLGPEQEEDGDLKGFARIVLAFQDVKPEDREAIEKDMVGRLVVIMPYVKAVLVELATIVFFGVAFGHRRETIPTPSSEPRKPSTKRETVRKPSATILQYPGNRPPHGKPLAKAEALQDLLGFIGVSGFAPSQEILRERFGVRSKGTVSKWLREWEDAGHISRASEGRRKVIT